MKCVAIFKPLSGVFCTVALQASGLFSCWSDRKPRNHLLSKLAGEPLRFLPVERVLADDVLNNDAEPGGDF